MPYAFVFNVPMELGLPFVAAICTESLDSERELFDNIIGEVDRAFLRMTLIDF